MNCSMCGREGMLLNAEVEGVVLQVCKECARFGKVIQRPRNINRTFGSSDSKNQVGPINRSYSQTSNRKTEQEKKETMEFVVENYSELIRNTREKKEIKQEDFARLINEKWSLISGIESGKAKPSIELARKIEKKLEITLVEEIEDNGDILSKALGGSEEAESGDSESSGFTIGDMINRKKV